MSVLWFIIEINIKQQLQIFARKDAHESDLCTAHVTAEGVRVHDPHENLNKYTLNHKKT